MTKDNRKLVLLAVLIAAAALVIYYIRKLVAFLHTVPTGRINETVSAVNDGFVNMFVYTDGKDTIAIDAVMNADKLAGALGELGIDPASVTHLFITHGDTDHVGGVNVFTDAAIYLPRAEEWMFEGTKARFSGVTASLHLPRPHTPLDDGDVVTVGDITVKAIATPGHTPGHTAYLVNGDTLFTGDTLSLRDGCATVFPRIISMDSATQCESIRKLAELEGVKLVCTAHTGCTEDFAAAMQGWKA
ncbi:MAG: MBL fold metallo-hydrolase [Anaerolineae bacterium]|nr:MBL fold metallo-hydrolase [Anaerolineae bacterium]